MRYLKNFNAARFFILLIVIGGLTVFSFLTAFGKDEGTLGDNFFLNFMANAFYVFRFPTHVLFWKYMNGGIFFLGLFINVIFYSLLIEFIISYFKMRKDNRKSIHSTISN
jgi:hypothetical protein